MSGIKKMIQLGAPGTSVQERFETGGFSVLNAKAEAITGAMSAIRSARLAPDVKGAAG